MNRRFAKAALYASTVLSFSLAVPAFAQAPAGAAAPAATRPAAAASQTGPEEIIVTARRVHERAQDVPIS
ncbi:MAG TPA: hypothetical protein VMB71_07240, partial [Acetobacteraceae bacterium]|nr:hypothetical protein [Acetobacteraceae bacterium]